MTDFRVDLLPFARPAMMGLPFHGRVVNTNLALPAGGYKQYASLAHYSNGGVSTVWAGGEALAVAGTGAAVRARTPEEIAADTAKGYNWKPYALLSGMERGIGGSRLGEHAWLYNDGNATWLLRAEIVRPTTNDITIKIWLSQLFGYFCDDADVTMASERLLCSMAYVPVGVSGYDAASGTTQYTTSYPTTTCDLFVAPKLDGSAALVSVGFAGPSSGGLYYPVYLPMGNKIAKAAWWGNTLYGDWTYGTGQAAALAALPLNSELNGVLRVIVSGTGSLEKGSVGNGIVASINAYKTFDELFQIVYTPIAGWDEDGGPYCDGTQNREPWQPPTQCECAYLSSTTTVQTAMFAYSYDTGGNIVYAKVTRTHAISYADSPTPDCRTDYDRATSAVHTYEFEFAGKTLDIEYTAVGTQYFGTPAGYSEDSFSWDGSSSTLAPQIHWDTAFGDRTVLFVEFCWDAATLYSYYFSPGGKQYSYTTTVSTLGSDVPYPTIIKRHGFISNEPVADTLTYAGAWPNQVFWV